MDYKPIHKDVIKRLEIILKNKQVDFSSITSIAAVPEIEHLYGEPISEEVLEAFMAMREMAFRGRVFDRPFLFEKAVRALSGESTSPEYWEGSSVDQIIRFIIVSRSINDDFVLSDSIEKYIACIFVNEELPVVIDWPELLPAQEYISKMYPSDSDSMDAMKKFVNSLFGFGIDAASKVLDQLRSSGKITEFAENAMARYVIVHDNLSETGYLNDTYKYN